MVVGDAVVLDPRVGIVEPVRQPADVDLPVADLSRKTAGRKVARRGNFSCPKAAKLDFDTRVSISRTR